MAEEKKNKFTRAGYEELQEELSNRKTTIKAEIGARIEEARAQGDLSENSEYDDAREAQAKNEARIHEIEELLKNAEVSEDDEIVVGIVLSVLFDCKVISSGFIGDFLVEQCLSFQCG